MVSSFSGTPSCPCRMAVHSGPLGGRGRPRISSYTVMPRLNRSHCGMEAEMDGGRGSVVG